MPVEVRWHLPLCKMGMLINTDNSGAERKWGSVKDLELYGGSFPSSGNTKAAPAGCWESSLRADQPWSWAEAGVTWCCHEQNGEEGWGTQAGGQQTQEVLWERWKGKAEAWRRGRPGPASGGPRPEKLYLHMLSESLSRMQLFATPWTLQSMEFFRPEHWSG